MDDAHYFAVFFDDANRFFHQVGVPFVSKPVYNSTVMEKILISACLVGDNTRFDGGNNLLPNLAELNQFCDLVPFCPEVQGGLDTPRQPAEIKRGIVRTELGVDLTQYYLEGAKKAYSLCRFLGIHTAILKENSPSCGVHKIHNGNFDGKLIDGMGITASYLKSKGLRVLSEADLGEFLADLQERRARREAFLERQAQWQEEQKQKANQGNERQEKRDFSTSHHHTHAGDKPHFGKKPSSGKPKGEYGQKREGRPSANKAYARKPFQGKGGPRRFDSRKNTDKTNE